MLSETYTGNGDAATNALTVFGSGVLSAGSSGVSIDNALASPATYTGDMLMQGMIRITRSAYLYTYNMTFSYNWLLETNYYTVSSYG